MINAETIAENRPDFVTVSQVDSMRRESRTHEDESCVQIIVVFLMKVLVVFGNLLLELVVEAGPGVRTTVFLQDRLQGVT